MPRIDELFEEMIAKDGSDLHLEEGLPPKIRQHGSLIALDRPVLTKDYMASILSEISGEENWQRYQKFIFCVL